MRAARRGSTAVEFALTLPVLVLLFAGITDLGQYLFLADNLTAAVAEGARAGALADPDDGQDPLAVAEATAATFWAAADMPPGFTVTASYAGVAAPDERIILVASAPYSAWFGLIGLPADLSYSHTVRLVYQP